MAFILLFGCTFAGSESPYRSLRGEESPDTIVWHSG